MFGSLTLKNFRCYKDLRIEFKNKRGTVKPRIYIYGDNASGKSSLLLSFAFLRKMNNGLYLNHLLETRDHPKYDHPSIEYFNLREEAKRHYRIFAQDNMVLAYEMILDGQVFVYEIVFNQYQEIVSESLFKRINNRAIIIFTASPTDFSFGRGMILTKDIPVIQNLYDTYYGEHTMLSILNFIIERQSIYKIAIKYTLLDVCMFIRRMHIGVEPYYDHQAYFNFFTDNNITPFTGTHDPIGKLAFEKAQPLLSNMLVTLFPNVIEAYYAFTHKGKDLWDYELKVVKKGIEGNYTIPYGDFPSGTYDFVNKIFALFDALMGSTLIGDDFDLSLHTFLVQHIIQYYMPQVEGQTFLTMDKLSTMNIVDPASIYICSANSDLSYTVNCIEDIAPTQANHNVRNRYEQGVYGELHRPQFVKNDEYFVEFKKWVQQVHRVMYKEDLF
ncbi:AAA family ATPase [Erysipelothrix rhusiopathiae]|nr:AAA family ATPase [Erysipelothrix rhusiopathiae]